MPHLSLIATLLALQLGQIQVPKPVGFVNDFARVVSPSASSRMDRMIGDVRAKSRGEIVVVTLSDLGGRDAADVAREIGRQWKVGAAGGPGDRARNAGVIILVVPKETSRDGRGHVRVEVGSGAEGFLTDATTGAFQDEALPYLRAQDYSGAIELITARVAERYAREFGFALDDAVAQEIPRPRSRSQPSSGGGIPPFVWLILFFVIIRLLTGSRRRRGCGGMWIPIPIGTFRGGGWGGGRGFGGGGGFSSFGGFGGGGGFSGGGSGRSW